MTINSNTFTQEIPSVYIETFGCQMNEYDSERILYYLKEKGCKVVPSPEESNIVIINTCAVREKAKNRLFGHLGKLKNLKELRNDLIICVGGCTAQSMGKEIQERCPFVDIVFGTHNISELPFLIEQKLVGSSNICSVISEGFDYDLDRASRVNKYSALVPVIIGCNNFCSYCIVPYVRGRERSLDPGPIIENIKKLVSDGVLEVTLLGQNVNSYGKDLNTAMDFSRLLEKVSDIKGLERIRFMTSHPKDYSENLIGVIKDRANIVNHIHLPLQSGSNRILKMMNRKYSREDYMDIVENVKSSINGYSITTDIIVGFPGEEKRDFDDTMDIVERVRHDRAFTFIYSPREGTAAAEMADPVSLKEKKEWFGELLEVQNNISFERNKEYVGKMVKVLVEGFSPKDGSMLGGRMENNMIVNFKGKKELIGRIVDIKIEKAMSFYLTGKTINK
ncbi:MAG: tRNA (N6-isopentenyl adenosine(37)-C2)-methylthiotransferase MiaB [Actinomycetia bacterium]|nr:tRNA (N6-isopentenyl adenosine(37)-C2)-methylthiotransferase MiaB [Actinomycetes bacterium]